MHPSGTWDLSIATPIGRMAAVVELWEEGGVLQGKAHGTGEETPLRDIAVHGNRLTWKQSITKPIRLNLAFDLAVDGDTMTGTSKAGALPSSRVTGQRRL
jgi:hypothetical protein